MQDLVDKNNNYWSSPRSVEFWCNVFEYSFERLTQWQATNLLVHLKEENNWAKIKVEEQKKKPEEGDYISASDFQSYHFCNFALYLKYQGKASQNVYDLYRGNRAQDTNYARSKNYRSRQTPYMLRKLRELDPSIDYIEWLDQDKSDFIQINGKYKLYGKADALVYHDNGDVSVLEYKSKEGSFRDKAYKSSIMQVSAYYNIYQNAHNLSDKLFIIYQRPNNYIKAYQYSYASVSKAFEWNAKRIFSIKNKSYKVYAKYKDNKCPSCGYRNYCNSIFKEENKGNKNFVQ
ncbi:PD-(D/E)XK nuclease family protein [bacterium]|nr:PD-(D/E)XK nuclease family protein [bacterium]